MEDYANQDILHRHNVIIETKLFKYEIIYLVIANNNLCCKKVSKRKNTYNESNSQTVV